MPLKSSAGKVRAPISLESHVTHVTRAERNIHIRISPWETLDIANFSLRLSDNFSLISGADSLKSIKITKPMEMQFVIREKTKNLKSVSLDAEITASGQIYRNTHEILMTERPTQYGEQFPEGIRKIKEID